MSDILQAINLLKTTFEKYAGKEGDNKTLTKSELSDLLHKEFPGLATDKAEVDEFFKGLDHDRDGVVNFKEYATFCIYLGVIVCGE